MGFLFSNDDKYVSKDDNTKRSQSKYNNSSRYLKVEEDKNDKNYHDTFIAYTTADGAYTEGYHGGNESRSEKKEFGKEFDNQVNNGSHYTRIK